MVWNKELELDEHVEEVTDEGDGTDDRACESASAQPDDGEVESLCGASGVADDEQSDIHEGNAIMV